MNSLSEKLCESIQIISTATLQGMKYDMTIVATIVDNSKKDQGTYTVSDGSTRFTAYSTVLDYRVGTTVYVLVPEGDLSNDKIIVSKKAKSDSAEPFLYESPFSHIVDITGNLNDTDNAIGLIANNPGQISKLVIEKDFVTEDFDGYSGFGRLGIRADFRAWLKEVNCISGNYGIKLTLTFRPTSQAREETQSSDYTRDVYLNVDDMLGDPYAFESYFTQEKVVDISSLGTLIKMKIEFYQDAGSFLDKDEKQIPYIQDMFADLEIDDIETNWLIPENIFVNNVWICLGFDSSEYSSDFVQIYSFDNGVYNKNTSTPKEVSLKWVHIENDEKISIDNTSNRDFEIRWYRNNKNGKADEYSGYGWEAFDTKGDTRCFEISFIPSGTGKENEQIKAVVLYGSAPSYAEIAIPQNEFTLRYFNYFYKNENNEFVQFTKEDEFSIDNIEDSTMNCYYKESDNRIIYKSNILTFINQDDVANNATIDAIKALSLLCRDYTYSEKNADGVPQKGFIETQGNYFIYNETGGLIDAGQKDVVRYLQCKFDLNSTEYDDSDELQFADKIIWEFPIENTMIVAHTTNYITWKEDNTIPEGYAQLRYENNNAVMQHFINSGNKIIFEYTINQFYNSARDNNLIKCTVEKDKLLYSAVKDLKFGQSGTSGTAFTFTIDLPAGVNSITLQDKDGNPYMDDDLTVTAHLYDQQGYEVEIPDTTEIEWKWHIQDISSFIGINTDTGKNTSVKLVCNKEKLTINQLCILKATLKKWRKSDKENEQDSYDLIAYLPIPIRLNSNYLYVNGPDKITYLSDGYPVYYKNQLDIIQTVIDYDGKWSQYPLTFEKGIEEYMPEIVQDDEGKYFLQAVSMYIEDLPLYGIQYSSKDSSTGTEKVRWTQPILIYQSLYPSSIINDWDGRAVEINDGSETGKPSYILSNIMGAGSKNNMNQFSGVMLGDVASYVQSDNAQNTLATRTGLFGFSDGAMCFSFTDDGKATIGKSSAGQIIFDGKKSTISSNLYQNNLLSDIRKGMILDFDDGFIKIYNQIKGGSQGSILLDTKSDYPLVIGVDQMDNSNSTQKFKVGWDGSLRAEDVYIAGELSGNCYVNYDLKPRALTTILSELDSAVESAASAAASAQSAINGLASKVSISNGGCSINYEGSSVDSSFGYGPTLRYGSAYVRASSNGASINHGGNSIYVTTGCFSTSDMQTHSDIRLKENILDIENKNQYLTLFKSLVPKTYKYKNSNINSIGFIAQQVEELVNDNNLNLKFFVDKNDEEYLSLKYNSIFTLNVLATQELYKKIELLEQEIKELKESKNE